ncbi:MAG: hypothetical protein RSB12_00515 [Peptostreptococcaceae bacterium]
MIKTNKKKHCTWQYSIDKQSIPCVVIIVKEDIHMSYKKFEIIIAILLRAKKDLGSSGTLETAIKLSKLR